MFVFLFGVKRMTYVSMDTLSTCSVLVFVFAPALCLSPVVTGDEVCVLVHYMYGEFPTLQSTVAVNVAQFYIMHVCSIISSTSVLHDTPAVNGL